MQKTVFIWYLFKYLGNLVGYPPPHKLFVLLPKVFLIYFFHYTFWTAYFCCILRDWECQSRLYGFSLNAIIQLVLVLSFSLTTLELKLQKGCIVSKKSADLSCWSWLESFYKKAVIWFVLNIANTSSELWNNRLQLALNNTDTLNTGA